MFLMTLNRILWNRSWIFIQETFLCLGTQSSFTSGLHVKPTSSYSPFHIFDLVSINASLSVNIILPFKIVIGIFCLKRTSLMPYTWWKQVSLNNLWNQNLWPSFYLFLFRYLVLRFGWTLLNWIISDKRNYEVIIFY